MSAQVSEYLRLFREQFYPELFSFECVKALDHIEKRYGKRECSQVIANIPMSGEDRTLDYFVAVDTPEDIAPAYRLEMDYRDYAYVSGDGDEIPYSIFYNATPLTPGKDDNSFDHSGYMDVVIPRLAGNEMAKRLTPALEKMLAALSGKCAKLYQLGAMKSRGEVTSLRIEVWKMRRIHLLAFLEEFGWRGDIEQLDGFLREWVPVAGRFCFSFDLSEDGISDKIGIEISARSRTISETERILEKANLDGFLSDDRLEAMLRWLHTPPQYEPLIQNDISHIEFTISEGKVLSAKAYLRQSGLFMAEEAPALFRPYQMNLELSDACPLRCPQCFVHLDKSRQMPLETALYWLNDAASAGIRLVSLSGGETACYPYLTEVIRECARLNIRSAVSFSGAGLSKERLRDIIAAGVSEIYISLNGSTKEINSITRDGWEYAIDALKLLKTEGFGETGINWVMHHSNSSDFPDMIKLCEHFGIKRLVALSLKADFRGVLADYPTAEDFYSVANIIKSYKGKLFIGVEGCLSQLRTLIYQGYLFNENKGLLRGCGAGRDGLSITCEGRLIPCRHLDISEEWTSIKEYWEKSELLKKLREIYDKPAGKCFGCEYNKNCLPCVDIGYRLHNRIAFGMDECPL